jgi:hypothetical protein
VKYFLLDADDQYAQPSFLNWHKEMNPKQQAAWDIPRLSKFSVSLSVNAVFVDILSHPYLMLSKEFADLVRLYDETIMFNYTMLYDKKNRRHMDYYMPQLEVIDCLDKDSEFSRDGSVLRRAVLKRAALQGRALLQIGNVKKRYIAGSLELVESAFRREVLGLRIREVELV